MWTNDSKRLLLEHFDVIYNSPSQLYHSALPFCPSSSWLHECYSQDLLQEAKVVKGLSAEWEMCSRTALLNDSPFSLSYWNNTIAVGIFSGDILILDAITGSQTAVLSGHTDKVRSVTFSSDGTLLVSGSEDKTVKLWDVQTGGVIKTFDDHTDEVWSVSISADYTTIASGSDDKTLRLWDIQKGKCHRIIEQQKDVSCVRFSPTDPQCLISVSGGETVQQWDIDGHKVGPTYTGYQITFSPDGIQFILHAQDGVTVHNINSRTVTAKLDTDISYITYKSSCYKFIAPCCFSPDHKLVAISTAHDKICVWDITGSDPHPVETFIGHTGTVTSLIFSSSSTLISVSGDESIKFWQIGASSTDPIVTNPKLTPLTLTPTKSITLKAKNGLIIPSDLPDGVIQTWGILTGLHKGSLQIPAQDSHQSSTQLIDNKLIFVWCADKKINIWGAYKINIWDVEKGELLQTINVPRGSIEGLRVSGDGSKIFCLYKESIQAWDIWTGEAVGKVRAQDVDINTMDRMVAGGEMSCHRTEGSKIWAEVLVSGTGWRSYMGWDFGVPGSPPVLFSRDEHPPDRLHLNDNKVWEIGMPRMKDIVTGKVVVQLPMRFRGPTNVLWNHHYNVQWDGHYLVVFFWSKVVILDFSNVTL